MLNLRSAGGAGHGKRLTLGFLLVFGINSKRATPTAAKASTDHEVHCE